MCQSKTLLQHIISFRAQLKLYMSVVSTWFLKECSLNWYSWDHKSVNDVWWFCNGILVLISISLQSPFSFISHHLPDSLSLSHCYDTHLRQRRLYCCLLFSLSLQAFPSVSVTICLSLIPSVFAACLSIFSCLLFSLHGAIRFFDHWGILGDILLAYPAVTSHANGHI